MLSKLLSWLGSVDELSLDDYIPNLKDIIHRPWQDDPIPHLIIDNLFSASYAATIRKYVAGEIAALGLSETRSPEKFSRMDEYDAYNYVPTPSLTSPLRVFYSREWYDLFRRLSGFAIDDNVMTVLHHHKQGSRDGYLHTDYSEYAFREKRFSNFLNHWQRNTIYQRIEGNGFDKQKNIIQTRRALALIYYVHDAAWKEGDGGQTAIYKDAKNEEDAMRVAPVHNRLLVLPISKTSYHRFLSNTVHDRNTVIQWFHESIQSMDHRLGISSP